jgi:hypothetical protein
MCLSPEALPPVVYTAGAWHGYKLGSIQVCVDTSFASAQVCAEDGDTKNRSASILQFDSLRSATFVHDDGEKAPAVSSTSAKDLREAMELLPRILSTPQKRAEGNKE